MWLNCSASWFPYNPQIKTYTLGLFRVGNMKYVTQLFMHLCSKLKYCFRSQYLTLFGWKNRPEALCSLFTVADGMLFAFFYTERSMLILPFCLLF